MTNWILAAIAVAIVGVWAWSKLRGRGKLGIEQPLSVREWERFATKRELQELEKKHADELQRLHDRIAAHRKDFQADINNLRESLNASGEARSSGLARRIDALQQDMADLPGKVVDLIHKLKH